MGAPKTGEDLLDVFPRKISILPILRNIRILRKLRILPSLPIFHVFYQYLIYFTTPCNFQSTKARRGWRKKIEYDFVLCIARFPGLKGGLSDLLSKQTLVIKTVSCYQNNKVYYRTGNYNLKCWNSGWNKMTLVL